MNLILSPEQRALQAYNLRHSRGGQIRCATDAVKRSLEGLSEDMEAEGGSLGLQEALSGLLNVFSYFAATLPTAERKTFVANVAGNLAIQVERRVVVQDAEKQ